MALVNSAFTVNVTPGAMPPIVHVSEYDVGRTYTVTINGENGSAFNIPTGTTATVEGTLNGVIGFTTGATISGSNVSFTLTESMTAKSGKAWCKIKLTQNDEPIQTCAFVLAVDRAGLEAETVIGADGFETQIVNAVNDWLDEHPPAVGGMSETFKQALLDCFANVAWIDADGQDYYGALYAALYPPKTLVSISAVFTQGSAVIYDTDDLDTLKQYLTVTAIYDDTSTGVVTNYTLSGTLTVGTSTITVLYNGKTATFNVTVTENDELMLNDILTLDGIKNTRNGHDASATTWEDLSGNDNDFARVGATGPEFETDHAVFDATDRRLHLNADLYGHRTTWTLELVVSVTGNGSKFASNAYYGGLFSNRNADSSNGLSIYTYNANGVSAYYKSDLSLGFTGSLGNTIGYIAYVFDNGTVKRYKNGVYQSSATLGTFVADNKLTDFYIGTGFIGFADAFPSANIYRIGMNSTAMTDEEIASRYAFYSTRFGTS